MKLVKENINDYLSSPSDNEVIKRLENSNLTPHQILTRSAKNGSVIGVEYAIEDSEEEIPYEYLSFALEIAAQKNHLDVVKYIFEYDNEFKSNPKKSTQALYRAAESGNKEIINYFLKNGPEYFRSDYESVMNKAKIFEHPEIVEIISKYIK